MIQILHLHAQCVQICCGSVETGIDSLSTVSIWYSSTELNVCVMKVKLLVFMFVLFVHRISEFIDIVRAYLPLLCLHA